MYRTSSEFAKAIEMDVTNLQTCRDHEIGVYITLWLMKVYSMVSRILFEGKLRQRPGKGS